MGKVVVGALTITIGLAATLNAQEIGQVSATAGSSGLVANVSANPAGVNVAVNAVPPPPPPSNLDGAMPPPPPGAISKVSSVQPVAPRLTPRDTGVQVYPAPVVKPEAGIRAPYGQGLAATAPVGTPYLRSPAFAGPPIIYMPQTVTRVLLPGQTPPAYTTMSPPTAYAYASAPFLRTDIYTSLPYGTYYWPQGYAGTTPVEPQVPAYVTAPSSAIMSQTSSYSASRYDASAASPETLNPVASGANPPSVAGAGEISQAAPSVPGSNDLTVTIPPANGAATFGSAPIAENPTSYVAPPPPPPNGSEIAGGNHMTPMQPPPPPVPGGMPPPSLPSNPTVQPEATPTPVPTEAPAPSPTPGMAPLPAGAVPSLVTPAVPAAAAEIVIDDKTPSGISFSPTDDGWVPSVNLTDSFNQSSLIGKVEPGQQARTATFNADIPADGMYEVQAWWVPSSSQFRASDVPVVIHTAEGPKNTTVDQTDRSGIRQWHSLGSFEFHAGQHVPILTLSTDGIAQNDQKTISVSVDAVKLIRK